jgi:hypothetical protein
VPTQIPCITGIFRPRKPKILSSLFGLAMNKNLAHRVAPLDFNPRSWLLQGARQCTKKKKKKKLREKKQKRRTLFSTVDSVAIAIAITIRLSTPFCLLSPTLLALLTRSHLLHSLAHDTRLLISSLVHTFSLPHIA